MNPAAKPTLAAAVLAGGRSSRMGRDKALLRAGAVRWVDRQLDLLRALSPDELLLSVRAGVDYGCAGVRLVPDATAEAGPLAGLEAVLAATTAAHVLVVAVDLPQLELSLLRMLHAQVEPRIGAVAWTERGWEPLVGIYPREALAVVRERLRIRRLALRETVEHLHAGGLIRRVGVPTDRQSQLRNINTPEELGGSSPG
jgi:molybdenum cofactor guanylyltransferase